MLGDAAQLPPDLYLRLATALALTGQAATAAAMLRRLLDEVRALLDAGYTWECPALSGLGYGQWRDFLAGEISEDDAVAAIRRETRAFVRRQYTWFNGHDTGIQWLDATTITPDDALAVVHTWLATKG